MLHHKPEDDVARLLFDDEPELPPTPTDAQPGSREKIAVLRQRAAEGFALFHPDDNVIEHTASGGEYFQPLPLHEHGAPLDKSHYQEPKPPSRDVSKRRPR